MKRLYWSIVPPLLAGLAALGRWLIQGSDNVYTDFGKDFYLPDPDLGWRLTSSSTTWLGLDAVLIVCAVLLAVAFGAFVLLRRERKGSSEHAKLRFGLRAVGIATLTVPVWAFATGLGPDGGRDQLPGQDFVEMPNAGISGSLSAVAPGNYQLQAHKGTQITASVKAGGETFEARFTGDPQGSLRFDPNDLSQPMSAELSVASSSVDTGIELRSKHAAEELRSEAFPRVTFALERLASSTQASSNSVSFSAEGTLTLVGKPIKVLVLGTLNAPDEAGKKRLDLPGKDLLILRAAFTLSLKESAIENDGTFDEDAIPIQISLVLVRAKGTQE